MSFVLEHPDRGTVREVEDGRPLYGIGFDREAGAQFGTLPAAERARGRLRIEHQGRIQIMSRHKNWERVG